MEIFWSGYYATLPKPLLRRVRRRTVEYVTSVPANAMFFGLVHVGHEDMVRDEIAKEGLRVTESRIVILAELCRRIVMSQVRALKGIQDVINS